jgi:hypothetical protein
LFKEGVIFLKVKYTLEKRLEILDKWKKANNGSRNAIAKKFRSYMATVRLYLVMGNGINIQVTFA